MFINIYILLNLMKNNYRNTGIIFLIVSVIVILMHYFNFILLFLLKLVGISIDVEWLNIFSLYSLYEKILMIFFEASIFIIYIWNIAILITLIKTNKYTKQLLYLVYAYIIWYALNFILYLPLKEFLIPELLTAIFIYFIAVKHDNFFSRIVKGKLETK